MATTGSSTTSTQLDTEHGQVDLVALQQPGCTGVFSVRLGGEYAGVVVSEPPTGPEERSWEVAWVYVVGGAPRGMVEERARYRSKEDAATALAGVVAERRRNGA